MIRSDQIVLLVDAHVSGLGLTAAAEFAGMSRASAWRYLQRPEVQQQIAAARDERRASMVSYVATIRSLADLVLDAVVRILDDDPDPSMVIRIASIVLPEVRHLSLFDLAERLERLESAA